MGIQTFAQDTQPTKLLKAFDNPSNEQLDKLAQAIIDDLLEDHEICITRINKQWIPPEGVELYQLLNGAHTIRKVNPLDQLLRK